jgi:predicted CXXCH cytochrome family protein
MKKVIVLAAAIALLATPAFAQVIKNSKHNLSTSNSGNVNYSDDNIDRICVFCHTPHAADKSVVNAPLWNRTTIKIQNAATELYNSLTLDTDSRPSTVVGVVNNSDAPLCLSCHDGASLGSGLVNPVNVAGGTEQDASFTTDGEITSKANLNDNGSMLSNDHPIGMDYSLADTAGTDFVTETGSAGAYQVDTLNLYGATGVMWCSSCHDVHDNANTPFLAKGNDQSALCLTCHIR